MPDYMPGIFGGGVGDPFAALDFMKSFGVDTTKAYNTRLTPEQEARFLAWARANNKLRDLADYDVRGYWMQTQGNPNTLQHGPDTYKKPNHPTFSNESKYSSPEVPGGIWSDNPPSYAPSATNLFFHPAKHLKFYFKRYEPSVKLKLPQSRMQPPWLQTEG